MLPGTIQIGAHSFTVHVTDAIAGETCGLLELESLRIFIREDLTLSMKWETLVHEIVHAQRLLSGQALADDDQEERIVQHDGHQLYMLLKHNPILLKEIIQAYEVRII